MSENQFQYGTEYTSVKVHHAPGGSSSLSLGWDEQPRQRNPQPVHHQPQPVRGPPYPEPNRHYYPEPQRYVEPHPRQAEEEQKYQPRPVQTSVRVNNPPGGQSSITFG